MQDIHINEVHTEIEITESVGTLGPAEVKKLVGLVMAQLKAQNHHDDLRRRDDRLENSAYVSDLIDGR
ncbi:hypothetical protein RBB77_01635 [Tunturibacter psychrotolerans]|uniref:Uncharacterized protein n=1 Tax=Tunturiibacter psychrotolerans TaxID=3069686 RepID=A0AAU7ZRN9_9BACT